MSAEELRARGNDYFKKSMFHNAINSYTESLEEAVSALTLANRAQAHLKLAHFESAYTDADAAVIANEDYTKARYRRALAALKLGFPKRAKKDCEILLKEDPNNKEFQKLMAEIDNAKKVHSVALRHSKKCESIRSETPLKVIDIEQTEVVQQEEPEAETSAIPFVLPPSTNSVAQFLADFDHMREQNPIFLGRYLLSMNVQQLPTILDNFLDSDQLGMMIRGLNCAEVEAPMQNIGDVLIAISMSSRFVIAEMMISGEERKIVNDMIGRLPREQEQLLRLKFESSF